jgi:hypothetical protein
MPRTSPTNALNAADNLLNTILNSRLQRKAKSIILSSIEFLVVDYAILLTYLNYEIENKQVELGLKLTVYAGGIYVAFISLFLFVHSFMILKVTNMKTTERIEKAYEKTNKIPFLDGLFEFPFPLVFRGDFWWFPYLTWMVCVIVLGISSFLFYLVKDELTTTAFATLVAGALLLYQITSDFAEYWVHSRHRESTSVNTSGSGGDDDSDDVEGAISVGRRETSSAGFTRLK